MNVTFPSVFQDRVMTGISDTGGCDCGLHVGGVAAPGPRAEGPVPGCDVGDVQQPGVSSVSSQQARHTLQVGMWGRTVDNRRQNPQLDLSRCITFKDCHHFSFIFSDLLHWTRDFTDLFHFSYSYKWGSCPLLYPESFP
ncbi:hypothetical protein mRhiFer1_009128 [Rhinolophus ferrumequinum]|uniref:Uncharacterized protein n=1 Tax=Rhinolophus ferrumequinum TaxID=59479 RepID=A0A7J7SJB7_RHIFE|nr:hypothetical protein mRhiFer1_009128 [Rhinolophus ferrumequinum]